MAFLYDFYKEVEMERKAYSFQKSLIAFTSSSPFSIPLGEEGSGWTGSNGGSDLEAYWWAQVGANPQGITVSGTPLFDFATNGTRPYNETLSPDNYWTSDTKTENGDTIYMAGFTANLGERNDQLTGMAFRFSWEDNYYGSTDRYGFKIERLYYTQSPVEGERTEWKYWTVADGSGFAKEFVIPIYKTDANSGKGKVFLCTTTIGEKEYIVFVCGADAAGHVNENTYFYALPKSVSLPSESEPYVGPPGEDDSEEGFAPENEIHDVILPREVPPNELYNANEPVLGGKGGFYVLLPNWVGESTTKRNIVPFIQTAIYRGRSEGLFNLVSQQWDEILGGTGNRSADEIQAILSAIVCCHNVPVIVKRGTYLHSWHTFRTIAGYGIDLSEYNVSNVIGCTGSYILGGGGTVFQDSYTAKLVGPRLNCFLDYEPYTQITLKLPFFPPISLPPSLVYDSVMTFRFTIDLITGFLGCDVIVNSSIFTTLTTNVKTDIPFFGTGTSGAGLSKITTAIAGAMSGDVGNAGQMFSTGLNIANEISLAGTGIAIGREGSTNIAPYFASRSAYVLITHPRAAIPVSKSGKATFLDEVGMAANLAYKVGECAGGWNKFSSVDLSTVQAPQAVKDDILAQLMQGVYIK